MKVELNKKEEKELQYPCLMICTNNMVVLFSGFERGVCVKTGEGLAIDELGEHRTNWIMDKFKPLKGSVTLSND